MSTLRFSLVALVAALSGCVMHGPGEVVYSTRGDPAQNVGGTSSAAGGVVSGGVTQPIQQEKEQRANTPPGVDRDGHGPAAGAIIDPTGAVTRGRPY